MTLKKQILLAFCTVSILALLIALFALSFINFKLSMKLYGNNLSNSVQIQSSLLDEQINRFLVRDNRFASSEQLKAYLKQPANNRESILTYPGTSDAVLKYTDEAMDSVSSFTILDADKKMLYTSGTTADVEGMKGLVENMETVTEQKTFEVPWKNEISSMVIVTPIIENDNTVLGSFVTLYTTDYFFKSISLHQQFGASNAFIYCLEHQQLVKAKYPIESMGKIKMSQGISSQTESTVRIDGSQCMVRWQPISKTPWILVNSVPKGQIYLQTGLYLCMGLLVLGASFLVVIFLSRLLSKRILSPLERLLAAVEGFLLSDDGSMPELNIDSRTEIGYLADKFSGMASDIAQVQRSLQESNYLYDAILHSVYCFRIHLNFASGEASSNNQFADQYLQERISMPVAQRAMQFFEVITGSASNSIVSSLEEMINGDITKPQELEFCCKYPELEDTWYQVLSVPILDDNGAVGKLVLHFEDISEKKKESLRLVETSQRDQHTGLLNKNAFSKLAQAMLNREPDCYAVFFIDLDNFKPVNDQLGHSAGDAVLVEVARRISSQFRGSDLVCRYGGDEFAVFVLGMSLDEARRKADLLVGYLPQERVTPRGDIIRVCASVGVRIGVGTCDISELVRDADQSMYKAKQNGKSQYYIWNEGVN